jgi:chromosome segregation ATPase
MPEAPAQSTDAEQPTPAPAGSEGPAATTQDGVAHLAATLQAVQARHDELLHRFLTLIEERRALDQALFAERFKAAGFQRDLEVFQRQWHATQTELAEIRAQNDHHKQLAVKLQQDLQELRAQHTQQVEMNEALQQELHDMRHSKVWQLGQSYWKLTGQKGS